jgi:hypothetical protein
MEEAVKKTPADVREFIVQSVTTHWTKNQAALLLSAVGVSLIKNGFNISEIFEERRLTEIISNDFSSEIKVVRANTSAQKIGLIPKKEYEEGKEDSYFKKQEKPQVKLKKPSHIPNVIWLAFSRPLATDYNRYIFTEPKLSYKDIKAKNGTSGKRAGILVDRVLIVTDSDNNQINHDSLIKNVDTWILENLSEVSKESPKSISAPGFNATAIAKDSLLHKIITSLSPDELARTVIPLDIIEKLLKS